MTLHGRMGRTRIGLSTLLVLPSVVALAYSSTAFGQSPAAKPGCEVVDLNDHDAMQQLVNKHGLKDFATPPELASPPTSEATRLDLIVDYANLTVAGCPTRLRTYNGATVGPTIRAKPGDTIHLRLINRLPAPPAGDLPEHPQQPEPAGHGGDHKHPFSFNITNLHTHGLHVAPQGPVDPATGKVPFESDNVLLELGPGEHQDYRFHIHPDHPAGTFWYHAHIHGSTAVQLSSGMAGALIIEGGTADNGDLDTVPVIGRVKSNQKIFVFQQLAYDVTGTVERFTPNLDPIRPTLINGLLVPVIRMRPGELQRWRLIHGGVQGHLALAVDGHPLHEVAADGITLGRSVTWAEAPASDARADNTLFLAPGYRSDVLIRARTPEPGRKYFVRSLKLEPPLSIQAQERAFARAAAGVPAVAAAPPVDSSDFQPGQILAQLVIEGDEVADQDLPTEAELSGLVPKSLPDITNAEIAATTALDPNAPQRVALNRVLNVICNPSDGTCASCSPGTPGCLRQAFQVGQHQFSLHPDAKRTLKLNTGGKPTAAEWKITAVGRHPFHIHVNPFQVERTEPDASGAIVHRTVWKDTILATGSALAPLRIRYTRFTGRFVLHCHILQHEDQGMMQIVEIAE